MSAVPNTFDPVSATIAGGLQLGLSIYGASERNKAIRRQMAINQRNAELELDGQGWIHEMRMRHLRRDAGRVSGRLAVLAAERGVGTGGSAAALERQASIDAAGEEYNADLDRYFSERRTLAELDLAQTGLESQGSSMFTSGLLGATQGATTGLAIGQGIGDLINRK